jgi:hypothetical protein
MTYPAALTAISLIYGMTAVSFAALIPRSHRRSA